jgi:hypothetical protein
MDPTIQQKNLVLEPDLWKRENKLIWNPHKECKESILKIKFVEHRQYHKIIIPIRSH